jgi:exo-1,4-beta-D-glucosaminidase
VIPDCGQPARRANVAQCSTSPHTNYEPGHTGYAFGTLFNLDKAVSERYGQWSSLAQYVEEAQLQNYEDTRAQFDAFIDHWNNQPTPSTGTIYWMLNKGWPGLLWDLYNQDDDEAGSFFGAQEANGSLHALYTYDNGTVTIDNLTGSSVTGLSVESRVYGLAGTLLDDRSSASMSLGTQSVENDVLHPEVPTATHPPAVASTYFVELLLRRDGRIVDRNVYWLSSQPDVVNWNATEGSPQGTLSQYADLTALESLPAATLTVDASTGPAAGQPVATGSSGTGSGREITTVTITNSSTTSTVGLFLRTDVRKGTAAGVVLPGDNEVLPVSWSTNDITLWPGESETLTASYQAALLNRSTPVVSVSGWNVSPRVVTAAYNAAP